MRTFKFLLFWIFILNIFGCHRLSNDTLHQDIMLNDSINEIVKTSECTDLTKKQTQNHIFKKYDDCLINLNNNKFLKIQNKNSNGVFNSQLFISSKNIITDSIFYKNIDPVGSAYGIYLCKDLICNYYIALKYGDYDGKTILINNDGKIFEINGGLPHIDYENNVIISDYYSDIQGFTMFDLKNHKLILDIELEDQINTFYYYKNEYFVSIFDFEKKTEFLRKIDVKNKKIVPTEIKSHEIGSFEIKLSFKP